MAARELNLRSKELMTVARLRMVRENQANGASAGRLNLTAKDMVKVTQWLESDAVGQEVYGEKLDQLLEIGSSADRDSIEMGEVGKAGNDLMHLWDQLDAGEVEEDDAFKAAEESTRRKIAGGKPAEPEASL